MTKTELQEHLIEMQAALKNERGRSRHLLRENKKLSAALRAETERFGKLFDYVKTLREWASCASSR